MGQTVASASSSDLIFLCFQLIGFGRRHASRKVRLLPGKAQRNDEMTAISSCQRKLVSLLMVLGMTISAHATGKLSPDLAKLSSTTSVNVIIQYVNPPTSTDDNAVTSLGGKNVKGLGKLKGKKWTMTAGAASSLLTLDANVKYVSLDRPLKSATFDTNIVAVNADLAGNLGYDGSGVGVAVIDSGINSNNDLLAAGATGSRIVYSQNFDPSTTVTTDLYGHGTHVAGIIAGNGNNSSCSNCSLTLRGVAPNANIVNLRALDSTGSATDSTVIAAIEQAIALKNTYNIRVINLSLGRGVFESYTTDPLCQAVEDAWNNGIVVVVAAGNYGRDNSNNNNGYGTITAPANDPYVITVGAMKTMQTYSTADDQIATYSSKGPTMLDHVVKPDLVAPGNLIVSDLASTNDALYASYPVNLVPVSYYNNGSSSKTSSLYYQLSGTSMAAPMVSGAAALMLQKDPTLTPDQVKARLMKTADKTFPQYSSYTDPNTGITYNEQYDIFTVGAGYLDTYAALQNTDVAPTTTGIAASPTAVYDATTGQVDLVTGTSVLWGSSVLWGNSVIWGTSVIWGANASGQSVLWGSSVLWGNSTSSAFSVLWGNSVIWGAKTNSDAMTIAIGGDK
jgi:serine protease AprX